MRFKCNGSSQRQTLGHNDDSLTRCRLPHVQTCTHLTQTLPKTNLTRLPAPHLGTTAPSTIIHLHRFADDNQPAVFLLVAPPNDNRPPRGASRDASPGQAWLQISDLALIPIVRIPPTGSITSDFHKNTNTQLLPRAHIVPFVLF